MTNLADIFKNMDFLCETTHDTKYSRVHYVNFVEDSP